MKQDMISLKEFCQRNGFNYDFGLQIMHRHNSPGYKIGRRWYVDLEKWEKCKEQIHAESYKWA